MGEGNRAARRIWVALRLEYHQVGPDGCTAEAVYRAVLEQARSRKVLWVPNRDVGGQTAYGLRGVWLIEPRPPGGPLVARPPWQEPVIGTTVLRIVDAS